MFGFSVMKPERPKVGPAAAMPEGSWLAAMSSWKELLEQVKVVASTIDERVRDALGQPRKSPASEEPPTKLDS